MPEQMFISEVFRRLGVEWYIQTGDEGYRIVCTPVLQRQRPNRVYEIVPTPWLRGYYEQPLHELCGSLSLRRVRAGGWFGNVIDLRQTLVVP